MWAISRQGMARCMEGRRTDRRSSLGRRCGAMILLGLIGLVSVPNVSSPSIADGAVSHAPQAALDPPSDEEIRDQIESILARAPDIPGENITVEVQDGVVTLTSSGLCDGHECPGTNTPAGIWTLDQQVGAMVRLVPGVVGVRLELGIEPTPSTVDSTQAN